MLVYWYCIPWLFLHYSASESLIGPANKGECTGEAGILSFSGEHVGTRMQSGDNFDSRDPEGYRIDILDT
jgi:hypothetical protein